jgi:hypothetical protein
MRRSYVVRFLYSWHVHGFEEEFCYPDSRQLGNDSAVMPAANRRIR